MHGSKTWGKGGEGFSRAMKLVKEGECGAYSSWGRVAVMNLERWMGPNYKRLFKPCFKEFGLFEGGAGGGGGHRRIDCGK